VRPHSRIRVHDPVVSLHATLVKLNKSHKTQTNFINFIPQLVRGALTRAGRAAVMPACHGARSGSTRQTPEQHSGAHSRGTAAPGHGSMYGNVKQISTHDMCRMLHEIRCATSLLGTRKEQNITHPISVQVDHIHMSTSVCNHCILL
jgi:hypothetical protein